MPATIDTTTHCSFCTKEEPQVEQMIAGPGVYICNQCVATCNAIFDAPKTDGDRSTLPYWQAMSDDEILAQLPRIASVATQVEDNLHVWVQRLRDRGVSWARIGESLGMARQSAWERFSGEE
jgi:ATP-dependent Clp protease ATP-binding subunit ClpX